MRRLWWALGALTAGAATLLVACASPGTPAVPDASRPHHRANGFQNLHAEFQPKSLLTVLQWRWDAIANNRPAPPREPTPVQAPDVAFIQANATAGAAMKPALTWIGHSSVLVQAGGLNVLIDPIFSERASPVSWTGPQRAQAPGLTPAQLPRIDVVLISHNHYDHLDEASVRGLAAQAGGSPRFLVPLGVKAFFTELGITQVEEFDWWAERTVSHAGSAPVSFIFTPAQHWSGRTLNDRLKTLWGGWAMLAPGFDLLYTGDTGYSRDFMVIRERLAPRLRDGGFDAALIPIGAYEPRWFMREQHTNPAEAVQIHRDLRARWSMGVHWGTFNLADESLDAPPRELAEARRAQGVADDAFQTLAIGQTKRWP